MLPRKKRDFCIKAAFLSPSWSQSQQKSGVVQHHCQKYDSHLHNFETNFKSASTCIPPIQRKLCPCKAMVVF